MQLLPETQGVRAECKGEGNWKDVSWESLSSAFQDFANSGLGK